MITLAFVGSSLLVITMPGPDLALIIRLVLTHRRLRPAVAAAAGMITAGAAQATVGALGLSVLLAARPTLFTAFRWAGAAVLLGMAALALRSAPRSPDQGAMPSPDPPEGRAFLLGLLCTGSNPKVGLFLMAFLPQFVPPGAEPTTAVAVLAAVYLGLGLLWLLVSMSAVRRLAPLVHSPRVARITDLLTAGTFSYFGLRLFLG